MLFWVIRVAQQLRRSKKAGAMLVIGLILAAVLGNAITYYVFDGPAKPGLTFWDAIWYSIISITTIGYGDYYAVSLGARLGTIFFVVLIGLSAFSAFLGLLVDWMVGLNYKELRGLAKAVVKDHILIINFPDEGRVRSIIQEMRCDPQFEGSEVVLLTDSIEALPFDLDRVSFVRGSPLEEEVLRRGGLDTASMAIVLCTRADDPNSDGQVASTVSLLEYLRPEIRTVAECLDRRHEVLFRSSRCDSIVFSNQIVNNILVQETQDAGVSKLMGMVSSNANSHTMYSAEATAEGAKSYAEEAKQMIDRDIYLVGILRDGEHIGADSVPREGDRVIYLAPRRLTWGELTQTAKA